MASDKSQFNQALKKWDNLQELGRYSEPIQRGDVAILVSGYGLAAEDISAKVLKKKLRIFRQKRLRWQHHVSCAASVLL